VQSNRAVAVRLRQADAVLILPGDVAQEQLADVQTVEHHQDAEDEESAPTGPGSRRKVRKSLTISKRICGGQRKQQPLQDRIEPVASGTSFLLASGRDAVVASTIELPRQPGRQQISKQALLQTRAR